MARRTVLVAIVIRHAALLADRQHLSDRCGSEVPHRALFRGIVFLVRIDLVVILNFVFRILSGDCLVRPSGIGERSQFTAQLGKERSRLDVAAITVSFCQHRRHFAFGERAFND